MPMLCENTRFDASYGNQFYYKIKISISGRHERMEMRGVYSVNYTLRIIIIFTGKINLSIVSYTHLSKAIGRGP